MYLRHHAYTLYYRHVCILVFLHVFAFSMLLRCMLKFKRLAFGSDDVTQYNTPRFPSWAQQESPFHGSPTWPQVTANPAPPESECGLRSDHSNSRHPVLTESTARRHWRRKFFRTVCDSSASRMPERFQLISTQTWRQQSGPALAGARPNARPRRGALLSSGFMTSLCSVILLYDRPITRGNRG